MSFEYILAAAFTAGMLGVTHCAAMCGGIIGTLSIAIPSEGGGRLVRTLAFVSAYNLGRVASYTLAGGIVGLIGHYVIGEEGVIAAPVLGRWISAFFMIAFGLYLTGWWMGLGYIERTGAKLWHLIEPLGRRLLPVRSPFQALLTGMIWGWLPCGLVYSALAWAFTVASFAKGALVMLAFGAGTLPALLMLGLVGANLNSILAQPALRIGAGLVMIVMGLYTLVLAMGIVAMH